tara:strand:- start:1980 stop:2462 length:483 start_codon:yes stop_codon:yes gene_type:complete
MNLKKNMLANSYKYKKHLYKLNKSKKRRIKINKTKKSNIKNKKSTQKKQKGGVLSKYQATALTQSIQKTIGKYISPEIVKSIADNIPPKLNEKLIKELIRRTRQKREKLDKEASEREDGPDLMEEDPQGIHFRSEFGCVGCETGTFNEHAHCTACREGRL